MDFLDSLDLDVSIKKSRRMRSWYLYEQFKSLERNQLDAARQLKDRSFQDKILRQELYERKARRKLYDQFGVCQSEPGIQRSVPSEGTRTSCNDSSDDFFQSYQELQDDECLDKVFVHDLEDTSSQDDSQIGKSFDENYQNEKFYEDDFKSVQHTDHHSYANSVNSVVEVKSEDTVTDDVEKYIKIDENPANKFNDIDLNFDDVKEKLQCLEKLTQLHDYDKLSINDSVYSVEEKEVKNKNNTGENNIFLMWSKLVSFAYQIMQLKHGNCYYDYGSQFLTAVLACDVLRRGINRMCHILQPYVSPIKYATDTESTSENHKTVKNINSVSKPRKRFTYKQCYPCHICLSKTRNKLRTAGKYRSENFGEHHSSPLSFDKRIFDQKHGRSKHSWRSILMANKYKSATFPSYQGIWPVFDNGDRLKKGLSKACSCGCHEVVNPMLRLSSYLDRIMKGIDDPLT